MKPAVLGAGRPGSRAALKSTRWMASSAGPSPSFRYTANAGQLHLSALCNGMGCNEGCPVVEMLQQASD